MADLTMSQFASKDDLIAAQAVRIAELEAEVDAERRHHGIRNASAVRTLHALGYSWRGTDAWQPRAEQGKCLYQIAEPAASVEKQIDEVMQLVLGWQIKSDIAGDAAIDAFDPECSAEDDAFANKCHEEQLEAWEAIRSKLRTLLSSAQSGEQVPFMYAIADGYGNAFFEEQGCVSSKAKDLQPEVDGLNENLDGEPPYKVVAVYTHPAQLSAVQTTKVVEALEMLENGAFNVAENAKNRDDDYGVGYAQAMAKMARDTLDVLSAPAHPAEGVPAHVHSALTDARAVLLSINRGDSHRVKVGDDVCYWQRDEWVQWAINEVLPMVNAALAATHPTQQGLDALTDAARSVIAERARQITVEGWTPEQDDGYNPGVLALHGGLYACHAYDNLAKKRAPEGWQWDEKWWKPKDPRSNLVKAGALVLAEIERMDRSLAAQAKQGGAA